MIPNQQVGPVRSSKTRILEAIASCIFQALTVGFDRTVYLGRRLNDFLAGFRQSREQKRKMSLSTADCGPMCRYR